MGLEFLDLPVTDVGDQTVPDALLGCWRRNWIRFGSGKLEANVEVVWLQTASGMGDLRIDATQRPEQSDSSCGITVIDETARPYVIADWRNGASGFGQQPVSNFPEKGWLRWHSDTIMYERAPSGAYEEEWQKLPGSSGRTCHLIAPGEATLTNLYVAGEHVLLAVERAESLVHEYSYGVQSPGSDTITIKLSTLADRVGEPMKLDVGWEVVSARFGPG